jgi:RsiW-degrading membrane proteinase PrsW (M82 family)
MPLATDTDASWSQMLPILFKPKDFTRKAYLIPGIITVIFVVLLFFVQGFLYQILLGAYLAGAACLGQQLLKRVLCHRRDRKTLPRGFIRKTRGVRV